MCGILLKPSDLVYSVRMTNLAASIRMEVKSDASPPTVGVVFTDNTKTLYKTGDLKLDEILYHMNTTIHEKKAAAPKK